MRHTISCALTKKVQHFLHIRSPLPYLSEQYGALSNDWYDVRHHVRGFWRVIEFEDSRGDLRIGDQTDRSHRPSVLAVR